MKSKIMMGMVMMACSTTVALADGQLSLSQAREYCPQVAQIQYTAQSSKVKKGTFSASNGQFVLKSTLVLPKPARQPNFQYGNKFGNAYGRYYGPNLSNMTALVCLYHYTSSVLGVDNSVNLIMSSRG